jgi:hypothetical protein
MEQAFMRWSKSARDPIDQLMRIVSRAALGPFWLITRLSRRERAAGEQNRPVFVISTYRRNGRALRSRNYQRIDPVLPESMKGILPLAAQSAAISSGGRPLLRRARESGAPRGRGCRSVRGARATCDLHPEQHLPDADWEGFKADIRFLLIAFIFISRSALEASAARSISASSRRDALVDCRRQDHQGIALILGLSDRTVRFYIET